MRISDWSSDVCSSDLAALEALADGEELPFGAVAIDFAEDHRGLGRRIFRQVIAHDFGAGLVVDRTDECVRALAEALDVLCAFVARNGDRDLDLTDRAAVREDGDQCWMSTGGAE